MRPLLLATIAVAALLPLRTAAQATPVPAPRLAPIVWLLAVPSASAEASPVAATPAAGAAPPSAQFLGRGRVVLRLACGEARGTYAVDGAGLRINPISLPAACAGDRDAQELAGALAAVDGWRYDGADLLLLAGGRTSLRLVPSLAGVEWRWQGFRDPGGRSTTPDDPRRYTVAFGANGRLTIQADCNRGGGPYEIDGSAIRIDAVALTRMRCPPGSLADEFVAGLTESRSFVFRDGRLYLALPMDGGIHEFAAAPLPAGNEGGP